MTQKANFDNPEEDAETSAKFDADDSTPQPLARLDVAEDAITKINLEVLDYALETVEENPVKSWMEIAKPILKSGGKTVAIIVALGFISIPLMVSGSPWVALVLAIGASVTAICSCL